MQNEILWPDRQPGKILRYLFQGKLKFAKQTLEKFRGGNAQSMCLHHKLWGLYWHRQSNFTKAVDEFEKAWQFGTQNAESLLCLAIILSDLGFYELGEDLALRAQSLEENGDEKKSKEVLCNAYAQLALSLEQNGDHSQAMIFFEKLAATDAQNSLWSKKLVELYFAKNQLAQAKTLLFKLKKDEYEDSFYHCYSGLLEFRLGNKGGAKLHWEKALSLNSEDQIARAHLKALTSEKS